MFVTNNIVNIDSAATRKHAVTAGEAKIFQDGKHMVEGKYFNI